MNGSPGTVAIAAPVFREDGIVGAIAVVGPSFRCDAAWRERTARAVHGAASTLNAALAEDPTAVTVTFCLIIRLTICLMTWKSGPC